MILRQYLHTSPVVAASYLFGCGSRTAGCVVDPVEPPEFYMKEAERLGLRILKVVDTHAHADHLSTGRALADAAGGAYVLHADANAGFPIERVNDGDSLVLGNTIADVLHVPGHTPEHIALLVRDRSRGEDPWFVLTGHTLMVGDMGRTELASVPEVGANALFESAARLRALPDHLEVLPGAFSGSVCGRGLSGKATSTIGFETRFNRAFSVTDRARFVDLMLRDIPAPPPSAAALRAQNLGHAGPAA